MKSEQNIDPSNLAKKELLTKDYRKTIRPLLIASIATLLIRFSLHILQNSLFYFTNIDKVGEGITSLALLQTGLFALGGIFIGQTFRVFRKLGTQKKGLYITGEIFSYSIAPLKVIFVLILGVTLRINQPLEAGLVASFYIDIIVMLALSLIIGIILNKHNTKDKLPGLISAYLLIPILVGLIIITSLIIKAKYSGIAINLLDFNALSDSTEPILKYFAGLLITYACFSICIIIEFVVRVIFLSEKKRE